MPQFLDSQIELGWVEYHGRDELLVYTPLLGRNVRVFDFMVPVVEAMNYVLIRTGYENPCDWTGSWNVRIISGTDPEKWSWHGIFAIDLDYGGDVDRDGDPTIDKNPHIHRPIEPGDPGFGAVWQILEHQVRALEAIRTNNGKRVLRWLGWPIGDTMHWEPACTPTDIATGIDPASLEGVIMGCPWTNTDQPRDPWFTDYEPCDRHYNGVGDDGIELPLSWGINTGICAVESWAEGTAGKAIAQGKIKLADNFRDDFSRPLTDGRYYALEQR